MISKKRYYITELECLSELNYSGFLWVVLKYGEMLCQFLGSRLIDLEDKYLCS